VIATSRPDDAAAGVKTPDGVRTELGVQGPIDYPIALE